MKPALLAVFFAAVCCVIVPINGQTTGKDSTAHQKPSNSAQAQQQSMLPPQTVNIDTVNVNKINVPQQTEPTEKPDDNRKESPSYFSRLVAPENLPNLILCAIGVAGIIAAYFTLREMKSATNVANKTLVLTQSPRIAVRAFYLSEIKGVGAIHDSPAGIHAGSFCNGQFYIQNIGGTNARIKEIWTEIFIDKALPMKRPYEGKVGSQEEKTLKPGQSTFYLFGLLKPLEAQTYADIMEFKTTFFYLLGWIGYTDVLGIYRITAFCRKYDTALNRFLPVDDPDYEYAD